MNYSAAAKIVYRRNKLAVLAAAFVGLLFALSCYAVNDPAYPFTSLTFCTAVIGIATTLLTALWAIFHSEVQTLRSIINAAEKTAQQATEVS